MHDREEKCHVFCEQQNVGLMNGLPYLTVRLISESRRYGVSGSPGQHEPDIFPAGRYEATVPRLGLHPTGTAQRKIPEVMQGGCHLLHRFWDLLSEFCN